MIEKWVQWTCDGCGATEYYPLPNTPMAEVRAQLRKSGFQQKSGGLDYCPVCVKNGNAARRDTSLGDSPSIIEKSHD